jgi:hypothetical protein
MTLWIHVLVRPAPQTILSVSLLLGGYTVDTSRHIADGPGVSAGQRVVGALGRIEPARGVLNVGAIPGEQLRTLLVLVGDSVDAGEQLARMAGDGLRAGGKCRIRSSAGEMRGQIVSAFDQIRPGCVAMYYPESNVLVPKAADPLSRTPAYKSIAVEVTPDVAFVQFGRPEPALVAAGTPCDKMNQCG